MTSSIHIRELDLLRFAAALAVVFFHYSFGGATHGYSPVLYAPLAGMAKYGYLGVDLFFMISGFVIMLSAQSSSVTAFAIARVARLYPAFWLCCTVTFVAILLSGTTLFPNTLRDWAGNMTMAPALLSIKAIDPSYWTLLIELKFYFLVGCVIAIGQIRHAERFLYGWLALALVNALAPLPWVAEKLFLVYAPSFIAGALFYFIRRDGSTALRWAGVAACWMLVLTNGFNAAMAQAETVTYDGVVVCATLTAFFVVFIAITLRKTGPLGHVNWPLLGALTYPLYLIHQTIGYLLITALYDYVNVHVLFWGTVALALAAAYVIAIHFERHATPALRRWLTRTCDKLLPSMAASSKRL